MRIHPPNHILASKLVPPEGDTFDGKFIPGGTKIAWNVWSLLRRKDMFGQEASVFRPERWLQASPDKRVEMERHVELIFGYGRYMCAGKVIAFLELNKIFFEVSKLGIICLNLPLSLPLSLFLSLSYTIPCSHDGLCKKLYRY